MNSTHTFGMQIRAQAPSRLAYAHSDARLAQGFTLVELLVVCSILAALAYTAWGSYVGVQESAEDEIARAEILRLADGLKRFKADTGYYPGQGPFILAAPGTTETAVSAERKDCSSLTGGVLRSWVPLADDGDKDAWFASPANLSLLFEPPALCGNHPLAYLNRWNPDTRRGWHGPYLDIKSRLWVDHGAGLNTADGTGSALIGTKLLDIPAFGAGSRYRAADSAGSGCSGQEKIDSTCMLGWRSVTRKEAGSAAVGAYEITAQARPFVVFGLANGDFPRIVYWGRDGRYGGRNTLDPCRPNLSDSNGKDDHVLCLEI